MKVLAYQIQDQPLAPYTIWNGTMTIEVHRSKECEYGAYNSAILIRHVDGKFESRVWSSNPVTHNKDFPALEAMDTWIAEQLTELSTGRLIDNDLYIQSEVIGLRNMRYSVAGKNSSGFLVVTPSGNPICVVTDRKGVDNLLEHLNRD